MQVVEVRVWDPFVRVCHWLLATVVLVDWLTDEPRWMHVWLGYIAVTLMLLRIIWGFIRPEYARFTSFVRGPRLVFDYLAGLIRFSSPRYLGHSPAGGCDDYRTKKKLKPSLRVYIALCRNLPIGIGGRGASPFPGRNQAPIRLSIPNEDPSALVEADTSRADALSSMVFGLGSMVIGKDRDTAMAG